METLRKSDLTLGNDYFLNDLVFGFRHPTVWRSSNWNWVIGDEVRRERPGRRPLTRRTSSAVKGSVINFAISGGSRAAEMKVVLWVLLNQVEDECSGAKRPGTGGSRLKFWKKKIGVLNVPGGRLVDGSQCWCWGWLFWKKEHYMSEERGWIKELMELISFISRFYLSC